MDNEVHTKLHGREYSPIRSARSHSLPHEAFASFVPELILERFSTTLHQPSATRRRPICDFVGSAQRSPHVAQAILTRLLRRFITQPVRQLSGDVGAVQVDCEEGRFDEWWIAFETLPHGDAGQLMPTVRGEASICSWQWRSTIDRAATI